MKDFNNLMYTKTEHTQRKENVLLPLFKSFLNQCLLDNHIPDCCAVNDIQKVTVLEEGKHILPHFFVTLLENMINNYQLQM